MSIQTQVTPTNVPLAHASTRATDEVALQDNLADHNELAIARAFLRHSIEFVLPPHYRPDVVGEMRVIGVDTKKLTKPSQPGNSSWFFSAVPHHDPALLPDSGSAIEGPKGFSVIHLSP